MARRQDEGTSLFPSLQAPFVVYIFFKVWGGIFICTYLLRWQACAWRHMHLPDTERLSEGREWAI